ncbi:tripartite tricarboxylate transporter TctB family protein [Ammoniphilus sp. CFH 90114]|uniref:tripartite tricarboxylate transporter TctB family protein n=1 Tax=Ammoniphilus sp. CFH 90114 TaxID=2493665 RepID=UPI00100E4EFD|nr:tripartite tricarboxylate transporter TctB family protein [Ammoniphilus sp. CFH 90114]RXT07143.1 hypothetical protein EIZ39_13425 [Ammoniphilus sp. CFH 90114]
MNRIWMNKEVMSGGGLLAISLILMLLTPTQVPIEENGLALSPRFFPYTILSLIGLLSISLLIQGFRNRVTTFSKEPSNTTVKEFLLFVLVAVFILLAAPYIGFSFSSMLGIALIYWMAGIRGWVNLLVPAILVPLVTDFIFRYALQVYLPLGFWEPIIDSFLY